MSTYFIFSPTIVPSLSKTSCNLLGINPDDIEKNIKRKVFYGLEEKKKEPAGARFPTWLLFWHLVQFFKTTNRSHLIS
jgi:hypothetical protein